MLHHAVLGRCWDTRLCSRAREDCGGMCRSTAQGVSQEGNYVFTTEGHPIPIKAGRLRRAPQPCIAPDGSSSSSSSGGSSSRGRRSMGAGGCEPDAGRTAALRSLRLSKKLARMRALHGVPLGDGDAAGSGEAPCGGACGVSWDVTRRLLSNIENIGGGPAGVTGRGTGGPIAGRLVPPDWGFHGSNTSALGARLCPHLTAAGGTRVLTACHTRDAENDGACTADADCGVDAWTCRQRRCSEHRFCIVSGQD